MSIESAVFFSPYGRIEGEDLLNDLIDVVLKDKGLKDRIELALNKKMRERSLSINLDKGLMSVKRVMTRKEY